MKQFKIHGREVTSFYYDDYKEELTFFTHGDRTLCNIDFKKREYQRLCKKGDIFENLAKLFSD